MMNLCDLLQKQAQKYPNRVAFSFLKKGQIKTHETFSQLDNHAKSIAAMLQQSCLQEDRVILLYPTGPHFISSFFACIYAGIIAVPLYPPDPIRFEKNIHLLESIIQTINPIKVLTTQSYLNIATQLFSNYPLLNQVDWITTDGVLPENGKDWKEPFIHNDSIAYLQYTSGSTRSPRGVVITHEATIANLRLGEYLNKFNQDSRIVGWVPLYHDLGLIAYVIGTVYHACHCYLMPPYEFIQNPFWWLNAISLFQATHNAAPSFGYDLCVRKVTNEQKQQLNLSSWEVAGIGAETVSYKTINRFYQAFSETGFKLTSFYPTYGMAESILYISGGRPKKSPPFLTVDKQALEKGQVVVIDNDNKESTCQSFQIITSCGKPGPEYETIIVDPQSNHQLSDNQVGEVWHSGPGTGTQYYQNPESTHEIFNQYTSNTHKGPFLRTGDLGFIHESELYITGRLKDIIMIRSMTYYPQDIEYTVQKSHPKIRAGCGAAFAIQIEHEEKLVIVQEINNIIDKAELLDIQSAIKKEVIRFHELTVYDIVLLKKGDTPKTSSGKIQRSMCKHNYLMNQFARID